VRKNGIEGLIDRQLNSSRIFTTLLMTRVCLVAVNVLKILVKNAINDQKPIFQPPPSGYDKVALLGAVLT